MSGTFRAAELRNAMRMMYPDLEGERVYLRDDEHPMTAAGIVLLSAALLLIDSPRALMSFTGYSFQFVSAIVLNMLNNRLWTNGRYGHSDWLLEDGTIEAGKLWEHIACGNQLRQEADSEVCADPSGLYWDERGGLRC
jgi:hypothetical protein